MADSSDVRVAGCSAHDFIGYFVFATRSIKNVFCTSSEQGRSNLLSDEEVLKVPVVAPMDCMLASQNKRPIEGGDVEGWNHCGPSKKFCNGLGPGDTAGCAGMVDCSMATLERQGAHGGAVMQCDSGPNAVYTLRAGSSGQCLRCMAGESGHINHILGY